MKIMRVFLLTIISFFLGLNSTYAYELILPKEKKSITNSKYTLFMGKARKNEILTINDNKIYTAPNGAFTYSFKLKEGENRIIIKTNYNYGTQIYKVFKNTINETTSLELEEFDSRIYKVVSDNTPLRSTPIDYGMNRIAHLFKDTYLLIDAQKGNFYRVRLSPKKEAWIQKDMVEESSLQYIPKFIAMNSKTYKNASEHIIEFTDKLPYTISEDENELVFKAYNPFVSSESIYTVNIRKPERYSYKLNLANGVYYLKISEIPTSTNLTLDGLNIIVDAGHGGSEKGAIGCLGDNEKDINLSVALELKNILSLMGANVLLTRECDANVSLDDRVNFAKENCANIFLSIHLNSIPDVEFNLHKHKGTSVYYYNENSKKLANKIKDSVTDSLKTRNDGVKTASFAVLRPTEYIGVLVELAYMINPNDSVMYRKESFPTDAAKAIAEGVLNYITQE